MTEIKWIKLDVSIFDNRKIKQIKSLPEGNSIILIWLQLMCLAGSVNDYGKVYLTEEIPYTEQMLATAFGEPLATVQLALKVFQQFNMIDVIDDIIYISNWEKYQAVEGMEKVREQTRKRVAKFREKKLIETIGQDAKCAYCGEKATGVDHIIPKASGGTDDEENLVPCCPRCNNAKNDKPLVNFLNYHRNFVDVNRVLNNGRLMAHVKYDAYHDCFVTLQETLRNAIDIDIEEDIDKEKDNTKVLSKKKSQKRFIAPTLEEIEEYVTEKGLNVNAKRFYDYFTEMNWIDSQGKPVKNWKGKILTWDSHGNNNNGRKETVFAGNPVDNLNNAKSTENDEWFDNFMKGLNDE